MTVDRRQYLSPEEATSLTEATRQRASNGLPQTRLEWLLVDMALQTGLRVSELARLTVGDVDLRCEALRVIRSKKTYPKGHPRHGQPRLEPEWLPISPSLTSHLRAHLAWLSTTVPQTSLWPGARGPWGRRGLQQAWERCCARVGLDSHIHQARHTLGVELLKAAPNPSQSLMLVQRQLGHSRPETTARFYADVPWGDRQAALRALFG